MAIVNQEFAKYIQNTKTDTRWADISEIESSDKVRRINIEDEDYEFGGIPLSCDGKTALIDAFDSHTIIFGSTGSKKTRLFGMPLIKILAKAGESFIVSDPKGELYDETSGIVAEKGYKMYVVNFRNLSTSDNWNPLTIIHDLYHSGQIDVAIELINDLKTILAEPQMKESKDKYFINLSCAHFLAMMLFFIDTASKEEANMFNFSQFVSARNSRERVLEIIGGENPDDDRKIYRSVIAKGSIADSSFRAAYQPARNTFGNITTGVSAMLEPFSNSKELGKMMSKSSFDIREIGNEKTAIYLVVPDEKSTLHFLATLFIKQAYSTMINEAQIKDKRKLDRRLNFVLDEFANMPTIPDMSNMITAARSRNIRFFLMLQGMRQLKGKYKDDAHVIKGNCDNVIFLSSKELDLLEEISLLCGTKNNGERLISTLQLQMFKKEWEYSEALIKHGRLFPFVSFLPDIEYYQFKKIDTISIPIRELPSIVKYDSDRVIEDIKMGKRAIPFSREEFGEYVFFENTRLDDDPSAPWNW
jgi:type IV secretion system protein VirD4